MKIFVTGAAGFIGRGIMKMGVERGHTMKGCDIAESPAENVLLGNVTDLEFLERETEGCDAIIHTAAIHTGHLNKGMSNAEFYAINVGGSDNVFQAAVKNGITRVVTSSSLDIHCGTNADWAFSGALKYTEATPDWPNSLYALSKELLEKVGHYYHRVYGIRVCAQRYVYIHGTCDRPQKIDPAELISRVLVVEDCAESNLLACESDRVFDDVLLIGPENPLSNEDIVKSIVDLEGIIEKHWPGSVETFKTAGFAVRGELWPACDITRAKQVLGWQPRYTYEWLLDLVKNGLTKP